MTQRVPTEDGDPHQGQERARLADERTASAQHRTMLANERTFSAWLRTSLGAIAAGLVAGRFVVDHVHALLAQWLGATLIAAGMVMALLGLWHYFRVWHALAEEELWGTPKWAACLMVAALCLGGILAAVLVFID
jgi:putative membrane protein